MLLFPHYTALHIPNTSHTNTPHLHTTYFTTHYTAYYTSIHFTTHYTTRREPLIYFEERADKDIRLAQRLPFFAAADVLMITATRYVV